MKTLKKITFSILFLQLSLAGSAQIFPELGGQRAGISALTFLKNDISPRSTAMGSMNVSILGDAYAANVNPALLSDANYVRFAASNKFLFEGLNQSYMGGIVPLSPYTSIGLSVNSLNSGQIEKRTEFQPEGTGEFFYVSNTGIAFSFAQILSDAFSVGGNFRYINESIAEYTDNTVAIDIGFRYRTDFRNLTFAVVVQNFGLNSTLSGSEVGSEFNRGEPSLNDNPVATVFAFGLSLDLYNDSSTHSVVAGAQLNHPNDNAESLHFGLEYSLMQRFFGYAGYRINVDDQPYPTFGFGAAIPFGYHKMRFDYGVNISQGFGMSPTFGGNPSSANVGSQHTVGVSLLFGKDKTRPSIGLLPSSEGYAWNKKNSEESPQNEE